MGISMDISMDIHQKICGLDVDMDGKFHIHGKPETLSCIIIIIIIMVS